MRILSVDPGTTHSGYVICDEKKIYESHTSRENKSLLDIIKWHKNRLFDHLAIEMVACYGMPVGKTTFETVLYIGRFMQAMGEKNTTLIYRKDVKLFLCNSLRAKDANVRQAILDKFPSKGGGKVPQIGTKAYPGPLYGITSHSMSALAVGLTFFHQQEKERS